MNVLIVGCGRIGARLGTALSARHNVTIVDWDQSAFDRLTNDYHGSTHTGNAIDVEVLREAGVEDADCFVALTNGDNRNLMAAQVARELGCPKVLVRIYDPVRCEIFSNEGLIAISPTVRASQRIFTMLTEGEEQ